MKRFMLILGGFLIIFISIYNINIYNNREVITSKTISYNGNNLRVSVDGVNSNAIPSGGNFYLVDYKCSNSNTKVTWDRVNHKLNVSNGSKKGNIVCNLEFKSKPMLYEMPVGSYVAYQGDGGTVGDVSVNCKLNGSASSSTATDETEAPNSCLGQNAREDIDTNGNTYGYCYIKNYKYYSTGWRIAYKDTDDDGNQKAVIVSGGSPECNTRPSSTLNLDYIELANTKALKYCNSEFVDGDCDCTDSDNDGLCDEYYICAEYDKNDSSKCIKYDIKEDVWGINDYDFYNITKAISGVGKRLLSASSNLGDEGGLLATTLFCYGRYSFEECGYNNSLIDNGGSYLFAVKPSSESATEGFIWDPSNRYVNDTTLTHAYGLRPVISLSSSVYVTGGSGTMDDPYTIGKMKYAYDYVKDLYEEGSSVTAVNIGGSSSNPSVKLNSTQKIMLDNNGDYRYYSSSPNNYVSFNGELWRIISAGNVKSSARDTKGEYRVKLIRDSSIGQFSWDSSEASVNSGSGVNNWSKSDLMNSLNTTYYNKTSGTCYNAASNGSTSCDFSSTGLNNEAKSLIDNALFYLGGSSVYDGLYADDYYDFERGKSVYDCDTDDGACPRPKTWSGKVGLMYPSDNGYATDLSSCTSALSSYSNTNCKNNNWLLNTSNMEWTISPYSNSASSVFRINSSGVVYGNSAATAMAVRPVVYLKSNVAIIGGNGTSSNPYQLELID